MAPTENHGLQTRDSSTPQDSQTSTIFPPAFGTSANSIPNTAEEISTQMDHRATDLAHGVGSVIGRALTHTPLFSLGGTRDTTTIVDDVCPVPKVEIDKIKKYIPKSPHTQTKLYTFLFGNPDDGLLNNILKIENLCQAAHKHNGQVVLVMDKSAKAFLKNREMLKQFEDLQKSYPQNFLVISDRKLAGNLGSQYVQILSQYDQRFPNVSKQTRAGFQIDMLRHACLCADQNTINFVADADVEIAPQDAERLFDMHVENGQTVLQPCVRVLFEKENGKSLIDRIHLSQTNVRGRDEYCLPCPEPSIDEKVIAQTLESHPRLKDMIGKSINLLAERGRTVSVYYEDYHSEGIYRNMIRANGEIMGSRPDAQRKEKFQDREEEMLGIVTRGMQSNMRGYKASPLQDGIVASVPGKSVEFDQDGGFIGTTTSLLLNGNLYHNAEILQHPFDSFSRSRESWRNNPDKVIRISRADSISSVKRDVLLGMLESELGGYFLTKGDIQNIIKSERYRDNNEVTNALKILAESSTKFDSYGLIELCDDASHNILKLYHKETDHEN